VRPILDLIAHDDVVIGNDHSALYFLLVLIKHATVLTLVAQHG
jgi:hypothetical protein